MKRGVGLFILKIKSIQWKAGKSITKLSEYWRKTIAAIISRLGSVAAALDVRLFLFFGGLLMLGYGLYLVYPWLSFTVSGSILMLVGWLMEDSKQ